MNLYPSTLSFLRRESECLTLLVAASTHVFLSIRGLDLTLAAVPPPPTRSTTLIPNKTILNPNLWTYINPNLVTKPSILHDKAQTPNYNILIRNFEP